MTSVLSDVIDFSVPIKSSGVSIVLRDPRAASTQSDAVGTTDVHSADVGKDVGAGGLLFVVRPLSLSVWMMLVVVYVAVCIVVHVSERLSPSSASVASAQPSPTTMRPTFWSSALVVLSTMTLIRAAAVDSPGSTSTMTLIRAAAVDSPGSTSTSSVVARPRTAAARFVIIAVGVFSVVLLIAYAVNMAALRLSAVDRRPAASWWPVDAGTDSEDVTRHQTRLQELVKRPDVQFVTAPAAGDVTTFLLDGSGDAASASVRQRVDELTDSVPLQPPSSRWTSAAGDGVKGSTTAGRTVQEALRLVDGSGRAFVGDSAASTYAVARDCDLVDYQLLPETRFYAVGLSRRSRFRDPINFALLRLRELGDIHRLQNKYVTPAELHYCFWLSLLAPVC